MFWLNTIKNFIKILRQGQTPAQIAGGFALGAAVGIAPVFDPFFHALGYLLLVNFSGLQGLWTSLYNAPIAPLTRFNNTVVMGSFVCGLFLLFPIYFGMKQFVVAYRTHIGSRVERWRVYQLISKSTLMHWYNKIRSLGE